MNKVGTAGTRRQAQTNIKIIGIKTHQPVAKWACKTDSVCWILLMSAFWASPAPKIANKINAPTKAGNVDHIKLRIWSNKSASTTAAERLVDSESGEHLSPKTAPEMIAPATNAGLMPIVIPIPKNAIPTVDITVNADPTAVPTNAQTTKTEGMNQFTLIILKPTSINVGMMPAAIQTLINAPTRIKMKIGIIPVSIPDLIPSLIACQLNPRILAQIVNNPNTKSTGVWGDNPHLITPVPKIANMTIKTKLASRVFTFCILFLLNLANKKSRLYLKYNWDELTVVPPKLDPP